MSILAALTRAYDRLPQDERPPFGYSMEKIGFVIGLHPDGSVATVTDIRDGEGRKKLPQPMLVPQPVKRTAGIAPNLLWDKTAYVLGVTAGEGKRTADEHAAFVARHEAALAENPDEGLRALLLFLRNWTPQRFVELGWSEEMKDQNVIFALESERLARIYLHDRPAAKAIVGNASSDPDASRDICLVSGIETVPARLHPSIKGVWGAQTAGAALVSFNLDAFTSYGHEQGSNAPISEQAAFAYTSVLNRFLAQGSGHRIQIGDASTVFWALCDDDAAADLAERLFRAMIDPPAETDEDREEREERESDDRTFTGTVGIQLERIRRGEPLKVVAPKLAQGVRFHVLGLSPNAARLSVRYWFDDDFGVLAENYRTWARDVALEPWPRSRPLPSIRRFELGTAPAMRDATGRVRFDTDRISPLLAGELLRAALTGARFPASLLSLLLMRVRGDGFLDSTRVALIKAVIVRAMRLDGRLPSDPDGSPKEEYLMRSDPDDPNPARRLGRLFAVIERAQLAALGDGINATVADKYLGAASATPGRVMPALVLAAESHHIKRLRNGHSDATWIENSDQARRMAESLKRDIGRLAAQFTEGFPMQLSSEEQGLFLIGYYQERYGRKEAEAGASELATHETQDGE